MPAIEEATGTRLPHPLLSPPHPLVRSTAEAQSRAEASAEMGQEPAHTWDVEVMATFDRVPASPEAQAIVDHLVGLVEALGNRKRSRTKEEQLDLLRVVGAFTGEFAASVDQDVPGLVGCPKSPNRLTTLGVGYRTFRAVYRAFLDLDLIEIVTRGSWQRIAEFGPSVGRGKTERLRATGAFVALVRQMGITKGTTSRHFPRRLKPKPLELRSSSVAFYGDRIKGPALPIKDTTVTQALRAEVDELNDFIAGVRVESPHAEGKPVELTGWTRIFNEGDHADFAWDRGGRLYAQPSVSYQGISKEERLRLTIDGEPVVEIDICASHLSLVYALRGISPGERFRHLGADGRTWTAVDPYAIGDLPRPVVKAWITATLGAGKPPKRWPRGIAGDLMDSEGIDPSAYSVAAVQAAVLKEHPVLASLEGISWATLQFLESRAIVSTMLRLKREHRIPALPVHDSLIVPSVAGEVASSVLVDELRAITGHEPIPLKVTSG